MYRSEVTEGWIRDCQSLSQTLSHEVRRRKEAELEIERLRAELEDWRERALTAEANERRVA
jgi:hypothetical protein